MINVGVVRSFRSCRWGALITLATLAGCGSTLGNPQPPGPEPGARQTRYLASNRNVDILFMIDNSSSMRNSQDNLLRNFPTMMTALKNLPGGLPNVHIGVISSDMGAGDGAIAGCDSTGGNNGIFQYTARGACAANGLAPGATYISDVEGVRNYTGNLEDVFTCIAALGEAGCGFEHQFASITRALGADGQLPPAENQGFLRPDAYLAIVMITNEDDCSAVPGVPFFDTTSNINLASQFGPPSNFRCNEFGHICDGARPNRVAPANDVNATVSYGSCRSNDSDGYLLSVQNVANRIKALKADDGQIMVAAITGAPTPYTVSWKEPSLPDTSCGAASCPWPMIAHSCTAADGSFADPAVRINELVGKFGGQGVLTSICDASFVPALGTVADEIVAYVNEPCIMGRVAKKSGTTRDDCAVVDNTTGDAVPSCDDTGGVGPCWRLQAGSANSSDCAGASVRVLDAQGTIAAAQDTTVDCQLCAPGVSDPARGCP
jgi:hypothetical protein